MIFFPVFYDQRTLITTGISIIKTHERDPYHGNQPDITGNDPVIGWNNLYEQ